MLRVSDQTKVVEALEKKRLSSPTFANLHPQTLVHIQMQGYTDPPADHPSLERLLLPALTRLPPLSLPPSGIRLRRHGDPGRGEADRLRPAKC